MSRILKQASIFYIAMLLVSLGAGTARAGILNDVPSCYAANNIKPADGLGYSKMIYLLIDQTVGWTPDIESSIMDSLNANLQPGTKFVIAEFSAFSQGRYLQVLHTGVIEEQLPDSMVGNTPIVAARTFKTCLADQLIFAHRMADGAAVSVLQNSSSSLDNSDILAALKEISSVVSSDPAQQKLVLLASDGLENSAVTSFYANGTIKNINVAREMALATENNLVGDFGGAKIYVVGGALSPPDSQGTQQQRDGYKSPIMLNKLEEFWSTYFQKSNATLVEFGEPALLSPVTF